MLKDLEFIYDSLIKYTDSLRESTLPANIFKYSSKGLKSLKTLFWQSRDCLQNFLSKYSIKDNITNTIDLNTYSIEYKSCISFLILFLAFYKSPTPAVLGSMQNVLNRINGISARLFKNNKSLQTDFDEVKEKALAFRTTNVDLKNALRDSIREHKLSQFDTSKITDKSISEHGLNEAKLINASFEDNSITLQFEVNSTGDNTHVDLTGKTQVFLKRGYSVTIQFLNTKNYLSPTNINQSAIAQQFNCIIKNCDVKIYCDCPAFYWQGMAEKDAKQGDSYFGFRGQHGSGYWNNLHNVNGPQACKHIWSAIYFVNTEQKQICDKLLSKVVDSSKVYNNIIGGK